MFYDDVYRAEFKARILEVKAEKKGFRVVLDQTCFYPEGGGQPADKGWINGITVEDVQKSGEQIHHYLAEDPGTGPVSGRINMEWRRDYMQQHTGQHIISGALWQMGKYKTVSVHMGSDITTIEIDREQIPSEDLEKVEDLANRMINRNIPVEYIVTDKEHLNQYGLRKSCSVEGEVRLVRIEDFDCVGCGGLHLQTTGEVGLVKAVGFEKIRGHARLSWKIGNRAMQDYRIKHGVVAELKAALQTGEDMFLKKIRELQDELSMHKKNSSQLLSRLAVIMADRLVEKNRGERDSAASPVIKYWKNEDNELIKRIMKELLRRSGLIICLINRIDNTIYWSIGCSEGIQFDFERHKSGLLTSINGKGGGRHPLWQGTGTDPSGIEDFFTLFRKLADST